MHGGECAEVGNMVLRHLLAEKPVGLTESYDWTQNKHVSATSKTHDKIMQTCMTFVVSSCNCEANSNGDTVNPMDIVEGLNAPIWKIKKRFSLRNVPTIQEEHKT